MKIKSGAELPRPLHAVELDWEMARKAAEAIVETCKSAWFSPPEAVDQHIAYVSQVCNAMDAIVDALKLRHSDGSPATRTESKT